MSLLKLTRHQARISFLLFSFCFVVHLTVTLVYPVGKIAPGDGEAYLSFAQGIADGRGFASSVEPWVADRPPLYPFLLSLLLMSGEINQTLIFILQSFVFSLAAGLFYLNAYRLFGAGYGFLAGLVFAALPHFVLFTNNVLTEALYLSFYVFLLSTVILPRRFTVWHCGISGVILGLFILLRREAMLIGGMLLMALFLIRFWKSWHRILQGLICTGILAIIVVLPWMIRNWTLLGEPVLSSATGLNLMVCNNPLATGAYTLPPEDWPKPDPPQVVLRDSGSFDRSLPCFPVDPIDAPEEDRVYDCYFMIELSYNQKIKNIVLDWLLGNPGVIISLLGRKMLALFGRANNVFLDAIDLLLVPFYISGLVRIVWRRENWRKVIFIFGFVLLTQVFISLVFCGGYRYRIILYPGLIFLAVYGLPSSWVDWLASLPFLKRVMKKMTSGEGD